MGQVENKNQDGIFKCNHINNSFHIKQQPKMDTENTYVLFH